MPVLLIHIDRETPRRLPIPPGTYSLGRDRSNAIRIEDDSISGRHCELTVFPDGRGVVRDAGSTNGTFVEGARVGVGALLPGQVLSLSGVHLCLEPDSPSEELRRGPGAVDEGRGMAPVSRVVAASPAGFGAAVLGAFGYPLTGDAWMTLAWMVGLQGVFWVLPAVIQPIGWVVGALVGVYLFHLALEIIRTTAHGEDRWPSGPEMSWLGMDRMELMEAVGKYFALGMLCFGPSVLIRWIPGAPAWAPVAATAMAAVYFPMALLAVVLADRLGAASPGVVIPSMSRTVIPYGVVVVMMGMILALEYLGERMGVILEGDRWRVAIMGIALGALGLYLTVVWLRVLGLFYRHYRDILQWDFEEDRHE